VELGENVCPLPSDLCPFPVWIAQDGKIVFVSAAAIEMLGAADGGQIVGKSPFEFIHPDFHDLAGGRFKAAMSGETPPVLEGRLVRLDGSVIDVELGARAIPYKGAKAVYASLVDQTRLKGALATLGEAARQVAGARTATEEQLQQANERLRAIIQYSPLAINAIDLEGRVTLWNPAAERVFGWTQEEVIGRLPPHFVGAQEFADTLERARLGDPIVGWEDRRRRKDGSLIDISISISSLRDAGGVVSGFLAIVDDVTDRKRFEEHLRQAQKLEELGLLAGGVAHDFNNLLTGILGNTALALEILPASNPARECMQDVLLASEKAAKLTEQLLAYAGKGRFIAQAVDLSELVGEISQLVRVSIPQSLQLQLDLGKNLPAFSADPGQIQQVVMNLIINAGEAMGEKPGVVVVKTGVQELDEEYISLVLSSQGVGPGKYVYLEVRDTGSGMTREVADRIFDPFFTTKFAGRGLGLAAVLGIVRGHRGAIRVYSAPGKGTTFRVFFPAAQGGHPTRKTPVFQDLMGMGTILVVDDEEMVGRLARAALQRYGYDVVSASNGQEAVEVFQKDPDGIAAVLLDLTMPVMGGEETLRRLQSIRPEVKVILSSGYSEVEAVKQFPEGGPADFIKKPYTPAALAEKFKKLLKLSSQRDHAA
jgi:PAS domain S-box-containing protein